MGEPISVHFVFERPPTPSALAAVVTRWRESCRLFGAEFASTIDPDERGDGGIAEALLTEGQPYKIRLGYGDVHGALWFESNGIGEADGPGEHEGARTLPHATFRIQDSHFYPDTDEDEAAVVERSEDLVSLVTRIYGGLAAHGMGPAYVYGALPGTEGALRDPASDVTVSAAEVTRGVPSEVFWLQIYPPRMVERLGERRLLSAPGWHTARLADGGVMVVVYETPSMYTDVEHSVAAVADHICGPEHGSENTR